MNNKSIPRMKMSNIIKRILDVLISILILITLSPILCLAGTLLLILEGSPIFYISERAISPTKTIRVRKFRTMVDDASSAKYKLNERFMRDGYLDIPLNCEVYTPIGRILERTQIVELLQLSNILRDEMSFIGNRPLPMSNIELLKKFPNWEDRFSSPCGITGISQIAGKYGLLPSQRINLEIIYSSLYTNAHTNILRCDALILWHTFRLLLTGQYLTYEKAIELLISCGANNKN